MNADTNPQPSLDEIYVQLTRGRGHEWVNDENVQALIDKAVSEGHILIAAELREWRSVCRDGLDIGNAPD